MVTAKTENGNNVIAAHITPTESYLDYLQDIGMTAEDYF